MSYQPTQFDIKQRKIYRNIALFAGLISFITAIIEFNKPVGESLYCGVFAAMMFTSAILDQIDMHKWKKMLNKKHEQGTNNRDSEQNKNNS